MEGCDNSVFFFTKDEDKNLFVNVLSRNEGSAENSLEQIFISETSNLQLILNEDENDCYLNKEDVDKEATWPTMIRDKHGQRLVVFKSKDCTNHNSSIVFYDLKAGRDIV